MFFQTLHAQIFLLDFSESVERMYCNFLDSIEHVLEGIDGCNHQIFGEEHGCDYEKDADKECSADVHERDLMVVQGHVECDLIPISYVDIEVRLAVAVVDLIGGSCAIVVIGICIFKILVGDAEVDERIKETYCTFDEQIGLHLVAAGMVDCEIHEVVDAVVVSCLWSEPGAAFEEGNAYQD